MDDLIQAQGKPSKKSINKSVKKGARGKSIPKKESIRITVHNERAQAAKGINKPASKSTLSQKMFQKAHGKASGTSQARNASTKEQRQVILP